VLGPVPWQQVHSFFRTLRRENLPFEIPIIVLAPPPIPGMAVVQEIFHGFDGVAYKRLPETGGTVNDLLSAGLVQARCVTLLCGSTSSIGSTDRRMVDGAGVMLMASIETELHSCLSQGMPVILELHTQDSVRFLKRFPSYDPPHPGTGTGHSMLEAFHDHPRFASGGIFTASCLGALCAKAYYTPGFAELIEALVLGPDSEQTSFPWQISLPHGFVGKTYANLAVHLLSPEFGAVCLGLYRSCFNDGSMGACYVVTNPAPDTMLRADDLIILLGNDKFAYKMFELGLIKGAVGARKSGEVSKAPSPRFDDPLSPQKAGAAEWDVYDTSMAEAPLPSLPHVEQELREARKMLSESLSREAFLRSQLQAVKGIKGSQLDANGVPSLPEMSPQTLSMDTLQPPRQGHFGKGAPPSESQPLQLPAGTYCSRC